jgi:hypothetical protein
MTCGGEVMHTYFISYEVWEPTGRFFHAWHWAPYETTLELSQLIMTDEHLRTVKNLLAYKLAVNERNGDRVAIRETWWSGAEVWLDLDYLRNHMHISIPLLLHSRP